MKTKIIAIVGPSGSGKTTMTQFIEKRFNIPAVVSYTTRKMRIGETNGVEHIFVSEKDMPYANEMLAYTQFGGYHYWATIEQVIHHPVVTYVLDEVALLKMMERFDEQYDIIPVYVRRDNRLLQEQIDSERRFRDKNRVIIEDAMYAAIIDNNGNLQDFYSQIEKVIKNIITLDYVSSETR